MSTLTNFQIVKTVHQKPWRSKPVKCYDVTADLAGQTHVVARFRAKTRAEKFADVAPTLTWTRDDPNDRHYAKRRASGTPEFAWPWTDDGFICGYIDETI